MRHHRGMVGLIFFIFSLSLVSDAKVSASSEQYNRQFPPGFKWCTATSAHQIEGGNTQSDWWNFEKTAGKIKNGDLSGMATDHWNRIDSDIQLMKNIGVNTYRFSVEWARIEPKQGVWDRLAIDHYRHEIHLLREAGIEPLVTLNHFTLPQWVSDQGGWTWSGIPQAFENYTRFVYGLIGSDVRDFVTINEPMVVLLTGYLAGEFPPLFASSNHFKNAMIQMIRSHGIAYHAIHEMAASEGRPVRVGLAHHLRVFDPHSKWNPLDRIYAKLLDRVFNWAWFQALHSGFLKVNMPFFMHFKAHIPEAKGTQDFLGINYYTRDMVHFSLKSKTGADLKTPYGAAKSDLGWEIYPEGLIRVLRRAHAWFPKLPVIITENGIADSQDLKRGSFLVDHLAVLLRALDEGIEVEGYCHWSLLDNFEWLEGFTPRFGLFEVDYSTFQRIPRPSASLFETIARTNRLPQVSLK